MRKKAETKKSTILSTKPSGQAQNTKPKKTMAKPQKKSSQRSVGKSKTTSSTASNSKKSLSSKPRTAKIAISPKKNNQKVNPALKPNQKQGSNSKGSDIIGNGSRKDADNSSSAGANYKQPADKSLVNIAHDVRINGLSSLLNVVQKATPKVKQLLLDECDLVVECRYCRNLFRSLPNFISHKLNYCKSLYHPAAENGCTQFLSSTTNSSREFNYQYYNNTFLPSGDEATIKQDITETSSNCDSSNPNRKLVQDASVRIEDAQTKSSFSLYNGIENLEDGTHSLQTVALAFEPVKGRADSVMFQMKADESICKSSNNVFDNREVIDRDTAILGPDGKAICTGTARGIEKIVRHLTAQIDFAHRTMEQKSTNLFFEKCDTCKTVFTTEKAFRQHRRDAPECSAQPSFKLFDTKPMGLNDEASPPVKRSKLEDNQFIRQLFSKSPSSTVKKVSSSTINGPSPSSKLSPYKKTIGKAVKNLQNTVLKEPPVMTSFTSSTKNSLKIPCIRCPAKFQTTYEMSRHLATQCTGTRKDSRGALTKNMPRISIEARNTFTKELFLKPATVETNSKMDVDDNADFNASTTDKNTIVDQNVIEEASNSNVLKSGQSNVIWEIESTNTYNPESTTKYYGEVILDSFLHNGKTSSSSSESSEEETISSSGVSSGVNEDQNMEIKSEIASPTSSDISPLNVEEQYTDKLKQLEKTEEGIPALKNKNPQKKPTAVPAVLRVSMRNVQKASLAATTIKKK